MANELKFLENFYGQPDLTYMAAREFDWTPLKIRIDSSISDAVCENRSSETIDLEK